MYSTAVLVVLCSNVTCCHHAEPQNAELGFSQTSFTNESLSHTSYQREFPCMDFKYKLWSRNPRSQMVACPCLPWMLNTFGSCSQLLVSPSFQRAAAFSELLPSLPWGLGFFPRDKDLETQIHLHKQYNQYHYSHFLVSFHRVIEG